VSRKRRNVVEQSQRAKEILSSQVRLDGVGEDPLVRVLLTELPTATNERALEIALALQQLLRGDQSYLSDPAHAEAVPKLREEWAKMDKTAEDYDKDPLRFAEEVYERAMKKLPTGDALARLRAEAAQKTKAIFQSVGVKRAMERANIDRELQYGPKVEIDVPPLIETRKSGDSYTAVQVPLVLRFKDRTFVLKPGKQTVPALVAGLFQQWKRGQDEGSARLKSMQGEGHWGQVKKAWKELDKTYGPTHLPA
jgi:hypothetical protein